MDCRSGSLIRILTTRSIAAGLIFAFVSMATEAFFVGFAENYLGGSVSLIQNLFPIYPHWLGSLSTVRGQFVKQFAGGALHMDASFHGHYARRDFWSTLALAWESTSTCCLGQESRSWNL